MKNGFKTIILLLAVVAMASCQKESLVGSEIQLQGKWVNTNVDTTWYRVFTLDAVEDAEGYKWGKEWHEKDDKHESDLTFHGNGWFKWSKTDADVLEIEMMEYGWADIPYEYTINLLTDSQLEFTEKVRGRKLTFKKVK